MSRLTSRPPVSAIIDGEEYPLNTNYRNCLLSIAALEDVGLSDWEKADILISNHYSEPYPKDTDAAVKHVIDYLTQNRDLSKEKNRNKALCFEQDGQMIYDALLSKGINLDESQISFWGFMAHLRELPKDCMLCRVIYLRLQQSRGKLSKSERAECARVGWDVINIRDSAAEQLDADISAYYESLLLESGE